MPQVPHKSRYLDDIRSEKDPDIEFRASIFNIGSDTVPRFDIPSGLKYPDDTDVVMGVGRPYGSWMGTYAYMPQDRVGKPYPPSFYNPDEAPTEAVAKDMSRRFREGDTAGRFLYGSIRRAEYPEAFYLVYIRENLLPDSEPITDGTMLSASDFDAVKRGVLNDESNLYIVTGKMVSNCGRNVLFPKAFDPKMSLADYKKWITHSVVKEADLFEWSIVAYGYKARYTTEYIKATDMKKKAAEEPDYAPTTEIDENDPQHQYRMTRQNRHSKRTLEDQASQARGSSKSKLLKIAEKNGGRKDFWNGGAFTNGGAGPSGTSTRSQEASTVEESGEEVLYEARIAEAMTGAGTDADHQKDSGSASGGNGEEKAPPEDSAEGDEQLLDLDDNRRKAPSPEVPRVENRRPLPAHGAPPLLPPNDLVSQWMDFAYTTILTPEQVLLSMRAVGPLNQVTLLGYQLAKYHEEVAKALTLLKNVYDPTDDDDIVRRTPREVNFRKVAASSTGPAVLMRKYLAQLPFRLPIQTKDDLLLAGTHLDNENISEFVDGYKLRADKASQEKPPETPLSTAVLNYLIQAFMENARRATNGKVERRNVCGILAGALFCRYGFAPLICMRRKKTQGVPRFTGIARSDVKKHHDGFIAYDAVEHADLPADRIVKNPAGFPTHVRVPMEYKANLYELCNPLVTIFFYTMDYIQKTMTKHLSGQGATPKTGKSSTGQTPRTTRAPVNDDDDEDAEVDAEGDEKHSKDNKLAQWVRNTRKWVCIDDLGIEFSTKSDKFEVWKVTLMASYGEFIMRQVPLEEYVMGKDSPLVKSKVESVQQISKNSRDPRVLQQYFDGFLEPKGTDTQTDAHKKDEDGQSECQEDGGDEAEPF